MKKTLEIFLCILLLTSSAVSLSGCKDKENKNIPASAEKTPGKTSLKKDEGKKDKKPEKPVGVSEAEKKALAEKTVNNFMDSAIRADSELLGEYCLDASLVDDVIPFDDFREYITHIAYGDMTQEEITNLKPMLGPIVEAYADGVMGTLSYSVTDIKKENEGYRAYVKIKSIDYESAMKILEVTMSEEAIGNMGEDVADELAQSGLITEKSTPEEIMKAMFDTISKKIIKQVESEISAAPKVEKQAEIVLTSKGDKMLVDLSCSKLPGLVE